MPVPKEQPPPPREVLSSHFNVGCFAVCSPIYQPLDPPKRPRHRLQIRRIRLGASGCQHGVDLTAVVGLVIEQLDRNHLFRPGGGAAAQAGMPGQVAFEPVGRNLAGPVEDLPVERRAILLVLVPGFDQCRGVELVTCRRIAALEATEPDPVAPQQVGECLLDGAEEGAASACRAAWSSPLAALMRFSFCHML